MPRTSSSNDSSLGARLRRRSITVPAVLLGFLLFSTLLLPALVVGGLIDVTGRRRWSTVRVAVYAVWWAGLESVGVLVAGLLWVIYAPVGKLRHQVSLKAHSGLQRWWSTNLVRGARVLLGMEYYIEDNRAFEREGPFIVLARHGSQGDALLVAAILASSRVRPRFVVKRQLLWDPCLDLVGHRIPNYFVDRDSANNQKELENIGLLAADLEADEALVIFPEGTRFSAAKRDRAIEVLSRTAPEREASASRLRHVLPIRTAGLLSVLGAAPATDLVFLNHVGVADFRNVGDLWRNVPFPVPLRFSATHVSRAEVPSGRSSDALVGWLDARWEDFDSWVEANSVTVV